MDPIYERYAGEPGVKAGDWETIKAFVAQDDRYDWNTEDEEVSSGTEDSDSNVERLLPLRLTITRSVCPITVQRGSLVRRAPEKITLDEMIADSEEYGYVITSVSLSTWSMQHNDGVYLSNLFSPMMKFQYKHGQSVYKEYNYGLKGSIEITVYDQKCVIKIPVEYLL